MAALKAAITGFSNVVSTPRGQIVNRSALLKEVETDTAALMGFVSEMDDMALQFDDTATIRIRIKNGGPSQPPTP